jgi:hypothetical protein
MTTSISGTGGVTFNDNSVQATAATGFGFKNRIINGAMVIDQRNAGASVTPASGVFSVDRFSAVTTQSSKFSMQQNAGSVTPPTGFANYLGTTSLSAYSILTGDAFGVRQIIEGFNTADLAWGTANASAVTLSFKVYSSLTGTFGGGILNSAANRSYPFTYSVPTANTWTTISVTIPGDTSGTWLTTNGIGISLTFGLGYGASLSGTANAWNAGTAYMPTGAVSVVGTNGATFYITGVQLEKGSTATSFDYRPYGTELMLCQRYFEVLGYIYLMFPWGSGSQIIRSFINYKVTKRVNPSFTYGTKIEGTGTLGVTSGDANGITVTGGGVAQDVVGYSSATVSAEL